MMRLISAIAFLFLCWSEYILMLKDNCTVNKLKIPTDLTNIRTIYQYNCFNIKYFYPFFPAIQGSFEAEYNEFDLSPNFYTILPVNQLCNYKYIYLLDMSFNLLTNLSYAFVHLKCLSSLVSVDFSNNLISSPIRAIDFDDSLASQLQFINLSNNKIPSIETSAFINKDGSSRFLKLYYLNLARNLIKELDILFPLTIPDPSLKIDLHLNPIDKLVNQMNLSFSNPIFNFDMTGFRVLDATNNHLQYLDDSNLLQYGLNNHYDLQAFLNKISNYDLRQSNLVRTFICYCPSQGLKTVSWYKSFASLIEPIYPIYQLYCSNFEKSIYILDFTCNKLSVGNSTTEPQTKTSKIINNSGNIIGKLNEAQNDQALLLSLTTNIAKIETKSLFTRYFSYFYLTFLPIPLLIISIFVFICCLGRRCQVFIYKTCSCILCNCFRPNDHSMSCGKIYDIAICYSEFDEHWLNDQFMPSLSSYDRGYKIHKLSLYHRSQSPLSEENQRILLLSKRIILMFSEKFIRDEWNNKNFRDLIGSIYRNDKFCLIVVIGLGEISNQKIMKVFKTFLIKKSISEPFSNANESRCCNWLTSRINYTCGLRKLEILNWTDSRFWQKFNYVMPVHTYDEITRISGSSKEKTSTFPKLNYDQAKRTSIGSPSINNLSTFSNNDLNFLVNINENKKQSKINKSSRKITTNLPLNQNITDFENGSKSSISSDYKSTSSVRHIVVPLPEEMKTPITTFRSIVKEKEFNKPAHLPPIGANILLVDHSIMGMSNNLSIKKKSLENEDDPHFTNNKGNEIPASIGTINSSSSKSRNRSLSLKSDYDSKSLKGNRY